MIVYLAGFISKVNHLLDIDISKIDILSSYWELRGRENEFEYLVRQDRFILDSGAFSAFTGRYNNFDWDLYLKKYAAFIYKNNIKLFFELDIDIIVGLKKVEYYRKYLEDTTGMQPIPVWHSNRKADYFIEMCENYPYVALGTTGVTNEGTKIRQNPIVLSWFINEAHKRKTKIHGLGFTDTKHLPTLKFDSVDSTSWCAGSRFGTVYKFDGVKMISTSAPNGYRVTDYKIVDNHNFKEWLKYQQYARARL